MVSSMTVTGRDCSIRITEQMRGMQIPIKMVVVTTWPHILNFSHCTVCATSNALIELEPGTSMCMVRSTHKILQAYDHHECSARSSHCVHALGVCCPDPLRSYTLREYKQPRPRHDRSHRPSRQSSRTLPSYTRRLYQRSNRSFSATCKCKVFVPLRAVQYSTDISTGIPLPCTSQLCCAAGAAVWERLL